MASEIVEVVMVGTIVTILLFAAVCFIAGYKANKFRNEYKSIYKSANRHKYEKK